MRDREDQRGTDRPLVLERHVDGVLVLTRQRRAHRRRALDVRRAQHRVAREVGAHTRECGLHLARDQAGGVEPVALDVWRRLRVGGIGLGQRLRLVGDAVAVGIERGQGGEGGEGHAGVLELLAIGIHRCAAAVLVAGIARGGKVEI